jgi:hypothetical protein
MKYLKLFEASNHQLKPINVEIIKDILNDFIDEYGIIIEVYEVYLSKELYI